MIDFQKFLSAYRKKSNSKKNNKRVVTTILVLLLGNVLFVICMVKKMSYDTLESILKNFHTIARADDWNAIDVIVAAFVGVNTVIVSYKLAKLQKKQAAIEMEQHRLFTEPHVFVDNIEISSVQYENNAENSEMKTIKEVNYPYYANGSVDENQDNIVMITFTFVNTSEAFARVRFNEASFGNDGGCDNMKYDISSCGVHENHIMLKKAATGKIGLLLNKELVGKLEGKKITISVFLDNNFNECFKDTQSYYISAVCEEKVSFMVCNRAENSFEKV